MGQRYLLDLSPEELSDWIKNIGEKPYHARQILKAVYQRRVADFSEITELSKNLRSQLKSNFFIYKLIPEEIKTAVDGTVRIKYLSDGDSFYTVFLPSSNHNSVCISTQIGCRGKCVFCASGRTKFVRNLTPGEIVEQVFHTEKIVNEKVNRVLFMGMGEPLDNLENVSSAISRLVLPELAGFGARNITVSTVGIKEKILRLLEIGWRIPLAFSLHTADYQLRRKLIPYFSPADSSGLKRLLRDAGRYSRKTRTELTIEYVLISGLTDTEKQLNELLKCLRELRAAAVKLKVNLIPYNPVTFRQDFQTPDIAAIENFQSVLKQKGFLTIIRKNRGVDIGAACGQLGFAEILV